MRKKLYKSHFSILVLMLVFITARAQDVNKRWAIGIGSGALLYSKNDLKTIGFRYSEQFPRLSVARYMFKNTTFVGQFSTSVDENKKYLVLDGDIRYDFGTSENLISIYVLLGGSLVDTKYLLPIINLGAGGTLWVSNTIGLNSQLVYKYNNSGFKSQASHIFASGGIVFRFSLGADKNGYSHTKKKSRKRLWEMRH